MLSHPGARPVARIPGDAPRSVARADLVHQDHGALARARQLTGSTSDRGRVDHLGNANQARFPDGVQTGLFCDLSHDRLGGQLPRVRSSARQGPRRSRPVRSRDKSPIPKRPRRIRRRVLVSGVGAASVTDQRVRALPELRRVRRENGLAIFAAPPCETPRRWTCRFKPSAVEPEKST